VAIPFFLVGETRDMIYLRGHHLPGQFQTSKSILPLIVPTFLQYGEWVAFNFPELSKIKVIKPSVDIAVLLQKADFIPSVQMKMNEFYIPFQKQSLHQ